MRPSLLSIASVPGALRHTPRWLRMVLPAAVALVTTVALLADCAVPRAAHVARAAPSTTSTPAGDDGQPEPSRAPGDKLPPAGAPLSAYLAQLPQFGPAPAPQPVTVPLGPSAGWFTHIPTTQRVAFLTIDDGWVKKPEAIELVRAAHVPVTLFLSINAIHDNPGYFRQLQAEGVAIEAHTLTHPSLTGKPYAQQRHEICGSADQLAQWYGARPTLFRPPFGNKDAVTLRAVHDCGMKAAFYWTETVDQGKVRYQRGHTVQPGDIILMHFRPAFLADFTAALIAIHRAGLTPALLGDYVQ